MPGKKIIETLSRGRWFFLFIIVFLLISVVLEKKTGSRHYTNEDSERFQKELNRKETLTLDLMRNVLVYFSSGKNQFIEEYTVKYKDLNAKEGIGIFLYKNDSLLFWSDNNYLIPVHFSDLPNGSFIRLTNSYFVKKEVTSENIRVIGLILVKKEYPIENRFIVNGFQNDFKLSKNVHVSADSLNTGSHPVMDIKGKYLFSLDYMMARKWNEAERTVCIVLYFIVLALFLLFLRISFKNILKKFQHLIFYLALLMAIIYFILHHFKIPNIIFNLNLFSPVKYGRSSMLPSLGDFFIFSVFILFVIYVFYSDIEADHHKLRKHGILRLSVLIFSGIVILILYGFTFSSFRSLIFDSTIPFQIFRVLDLSSYTFIGFLILGFLFTSLVLMVDKVLLTLKKMHLKNDAFLFIIILNANAFALLIPYNKQIPAESAVFFLAVTFLVYYFRFHRTLINRFSVYVPFLILFSTFTVFEVVKFSERKRKEDMKIRAVNLSTEHDPVAELLFVDINKRLDEDKDLAELILSEPFSTDVIYLFLQRKYFSGFWDKYDLQITLCAPPDSVYVLPPVDRQFLCYEYFAESIMADAVPVPNTDFHFLDNMNGRISYFTDRVFSDETQKVTLFIELDTRLIAEGLGYPELLLDEQIPDPVSEQEYSYAKYNRGRLISFSGNFPYYMTNIVYTDGKEGFSFIKKDDYEHLVYNIDSENTILVSKPAVFWVDLIISFSYIFAFYFISFLILLLITGRNPFPSEFHWNFKNKIQMAMTSLLFFSLLFIGAGIVYFSIQQYRNKHIEILQEKMQSIYIELIHKLEFEKDLHSWESEEFYSLNGLLERLSNVFYTDINLYDASGDLMATSRPEIFDKGLIAPRMNSSAYMEMVIHQRSEFISNEYIGDLNYISSYIPFVNTENKLLAYLNLPYFTRQNELTREITNLVVAIVNILVLLSLLSFTIAVFMSNTITQPLRLIQEKFALISLRGKNEKIEYNPRDEIGSLVNAYNEMVDQLEKSAEMLAKSERESAWREMAKQIAHEIKNPLTPMRLSIQHLQRTWNDKSENWDEQLKRISKTIIDQIDNLSAIATEFSNFAKMPQTNNEKLNMVVLLEETLGLFDNTENTTITLNLNGLSEVYVFADREQLSRVFINLIKNAIQACSEGRESKVAVSLYTSSEKAIIKVKDNGKGISEEIKDKMFQPNFTTKSSGMGMGLAIVKSIVKNEGGEIFFTTELNKGSIFTVELPVYKNEV